MTKNWGEGANCVAGGNSDCTSSDGASWTIYDLYYEIFFADLCYEILTSFADLYCAIFPYFLT